MSNLIGTRVNPNWFTKWITMEGPFHAKIGVTEVKTEYQEEFKQCIQAQQVQQYKQSMAAGEDVQFAPLESGCGSCAWDSQGMTLQDYLDDALAWSRFRVAFQTVDPETGEFYTGKQRRPWGFHPHPSRFACHLPPSRGEGSNIGSRPTAE